MQDHILIALKLLLTIIPKASSAMVNNSNTTKSKLSGVSLKNDAQQIVAVKAAMITNSNP